VPLSEEELRLLEQMERALVAEDPKLASTLRGTKLRKQARRQMVLGVLAFLVGIAVLMGGVILQRPVIGVAGFVIMLGSAYLTLSSYKNRNRALSTPPPPTTDPTAGLRVVQGGRANRTRPTTGRSRTPRPPKQGSMMERFEERWRRRREQNGGM
jgi:Protein of unknown function (DUF3040)